MRKKVEEGIIEEIEASLLLIIIIIIIIIIIGH
jgi:hypothetical protein